MIKMVNLVFCMLFLVVTKTICIDSGVISLSKNLQSLSFSQSNKNVIQYYQSAEKIIDSIKNNNLQKDEKVCLVSFAAGKLEREDNNIIQPLKNAGYSNIKVIAIDTISQNQILPGVSIVSTKDAYTFIADPVKDYGDLLIAYNPPIVLGGYYSIYRNVLKVGGFKTHVTGMHFHFTGNLEKFMNFFIPIEFKKISFVSGINNDVTDILGQLALIVKQSTSREMLIQALKDFFSREVVEFEFYADLALTCYELIKYTLKPFAQAFVYWRDYIDISWMRDMSPSQAIYTFYSAIPLDQMPSLAASSPLTAMFREKNKWQGDFYVFNSETAIFDKYNPE